MCVNKTISLFLFCVLIVIPVFSQETGDAVDAQFAQIAENPAVKKGLNACAVADRKAKEECIRSTRKLLENARKAGQQGYVEILQADLDFLNSDEFSPYEFSRYDTQTPRREAALKFLANRKQCVDALEKVHTTFTKRGEEDSAVAVRKLIDEIKKRSAVLAQGKFVSLKDYLETIPQATRQGRISTVNHQGGQFDTSNLWSENIRISPDGKKLVGSGGNWVTAWNTETGQAETHFPDRKGDFFAGAFSADGRKFYAGCKNGWVCRYDTETWLMEKSMRQEEGVIIQIVPYPDGSVYVADFHAGIKRFDFVDDRIETFGTPRIAFSLDINPEGTWLLAGFSDGMIAVFDLKTRKMLNLWKHGDREVQAVRFYKHSTQVISACLDSTVAIWDTRTGERIARFSDFPKYPRDLLLNKDESLLFVTQNRWYEWDDGAIYFVVMIDLKSKLPVYSFPVRERVASSSALSADEKLLYTPARADVGVQIWNVPDRASIDEALKKITPRYSLPILQ